MEIPWTIPKSWEWAEIKSVGDVISGGTPSTKEPSYWGDEINWISPADLTGYSKKYISKGAKSITQKGLENGSAKLMPAGSVHFSSRAPIGYVAISSQKLCTNQGFKSLVPAKGVFNEYIYYYFKAAKHLAEERATGTTFREISGATFGKLPFPLAPSNEQHRIVAKIEELFSELDKGVESLKTARAQLKVYRQALLKHAFEGKLTEQWRKDNADKLEIANELLARIKTEREQRYQLQIGEWEASVKAWMDKGKLGKRLTKPRRQKDVMELDNEESEELPFIPKSWCWVKLGQLVWSVKDGPHYSPKYVDEGIPFISGGNIRPNGIDFKTAKYISEDLHEELSVRCKPEPGDVLYTKGGTTGIARVNTYDIEFNVWVHVAVLKITDSLNSFYLQHALNSPSCYQQSQRYTHGVGNQDLGLTRMVNIILPLCCESEQTQIYETVERLTSEFDVLEQANDDQLEKCTALRQSILKKAFSGQLVPQNPDDEPAAVLLERIRAEKTAMAEKTKQAKPKQRKKRKTAA